MQKRVPNGTLVIAERQDAGKGRRGRGFDSLGEAGNLMTLLLKPEIDPNRCFHDVSDGACSVKGDYGYDRQAVSNGRTTSSDGKKRAAF